MNVLHLRQGSLSIGFEYGVEGCNAMAGSLLRRKRGRVSQPPTPSLRAAAGDGPACALRLQESNQKIRVGAAWARRRPNAPARRVTRPPSRVRPLLLWRASARLVRGRRRIETDGGPAWCGRMTANSNRLAPSDQTPALSAVQKAAMQLTKYLSCSAVAAANVSVCSGCGSRRFGLIRYTWDGHQFCRKECRERFKRRLNTDLARLTGWRMFPTD